MSSDQQLPWLVSAPVMEARSVSSSQPFESNETELLVRTPDIELDQAKSFVRSPLAWLPWLFGAVAGMALTLLLLQADVGRLSFLDNISSWRILDHSRTLLVDDNSGLAGSATSGKEVHLIKLRSAPAWSLPSSWSAADTAPYPSLQTVLSSQVAPGLRTLLSCTASSRRLAVMTSISAFPTAAQIGLALLDTPWCIVVIGDKKGPSHAVFLEGFEQGVEQYLKKMAFNKQLETPKDVAISRMQLLNRIAYIDTSEQQLFPYRLHQLTPYGSFSRKNLGFLLAFHCGVSVLFDVDDDNIYLPNSAHAGSDNADLPVDFVARHYASSQPFDQKVLSKFNSDDGAPSGGSLKPVNISLFNPYPVFGAEDAWPRGFPLRVVKQTLKPEHHYDALCMESTRFCSAVVQQYLANHDPDVDAVYRLTNSLGMPFDFLASSHGAMTEPAVARAAPSIALPSSTYVPFNAQATIIMPGAFMLMMLPHTVHGRVADIWRSYFMQTLMSFYTLDVSNTMHLKNRSSASVNPSQTMAEPCIAFTSPHIYHDRNAHNYQLDFNSELPLYTQAEALVSWLTVRELEGEHSLLMRVHSTATAERIMLDLMMLLYVDLYEVGVVQSAELAYAQAWISDFIKIAASHRFVATPPLHAAATRVDDKKCFPKYTQV